MELKAGDAAVLAVVHELLEHVNLVHTEQRTVSHVKS